MTAPDSSERALWRCESCGHIFTEWPIPGVSVGADGHEVTVPHPYTGEPEQEPCGEVVRYTPARRDDTAELVAALEAWLAWATARTRRTSTSVAFPNLHLPIGDLVATSRAALARVKGGERL